MSKTYSYFLSKSSRLIRQLFISEGNSKSRLRDCHTELFIVLNSPIPPDLHSKRDKILKRLTKTGNSFSKTIQLMRQKTAANILRDYYDLYSEIKNRIN